MKDLVWWALFMLAWTAVELAEDYRQERCADHGGNWVKTSWFHKDYCNRPAGSCK